MNTEEIAVKRVALKPSTWESLSNLRKPGQTFNDVVESLIVSEQKKRLMHDLDAAAAESSIPWSEAAKKTWALKNVVCKAQRTKIYRTVNGKGSPDYW